MPRARDGGGAGREVPALRRVRSGSALRGDAGPAGRSARLGDQPRAGARPGQRARRPSAGQRARRDRPPTVRGGSPRERGAAPPGAGRGRHRDVGLGFGDRGCPVVAGDGRHQGGGVCRGWRRPAHDLGEDRAPGRPGPRRGGDGGGRRRAPPVPLRASRPLQPGRRGALAAQPRPRRVPPRPRRPMPRAACSAS